MIFPEALVERQVHPEAEKDLHEHHSQQTVATGIAS
jgi:hypothetical protein